MLAILPGTHKASDPCGESNGRFCIGNPRKHSIFLFSLTRVKRTEVSWQRKMDRAQTEVSGQRKTGRQKDIGRLKFSQR